MSLYGWAVCRIRPASVVLSILASVAAVSVMPAIGGMASAAGVSPTVTAPTGVPSPLPATPSCDYHDLTGALVTGGPVAVTAGEGIENGDRVRNTTSQLIHTLINVELVNLLATTPVHATTERSPTLSWGVDGGAWHRVTLVRRTSGPSNQTEWDSDVLSGPTFAPNSTHLLRLWVAYNTTSPGGYWDGAFGFSSPDCQNLGSSVLIPLAYDPGEVHTPSGGTRGHQPPTPHASPHVTPLTSPRPSPAVATPKATMPPASAPALAASVTSTAAAAHVASTHGQAILRAVGSGVAGLVVASAAFQAVRWRRSRIRTPRG